MSAIAQRVLRPGVWRGLTLGLWPWGAAMYATRGGVFGLGYASAADHLPHLGASAVGGAL